MLTYDFELNKQQLLYQTIDRASHGLLCNLLDMEWERRACYISIEYYFNYNAMRFALNGYYI